MKNLKFFIKAAFLLIFGLTLNIYSFGQCETWVNSPDKDLLEEEHVLYRQYVKQEQYDQAFIHWKKVYEAAPAADGQRSFHYSDGRKIYMYKYKNETDEAKKKEYVDIILGLYDEQIKCYPKEATLALGLKAFDMFYTLHSPYPELLKVLETAVETSGNDASYVILQPYASVVVYMFAKEQMDKLQARSIYQKLNEIADYNIEHNKKYGDRYKQAKASMNGTFAAIENNIFDCAYFKEKLEPDYRADPDNWDLIKQIYNRLVAQECPEGDPLVSELKKKYDVLVAEENEKRQAEFNKNNPGAHAKSLYDERKFGEAIEEYKRAIAQERAKEDEADKDQLANYYFAIASIEFRKLKKYNSARGYARKAANYRPGWGKPYMLIADMYAATSSSCGKEAWDKQMAVLAALDKYAYAKSIDPSLAEEASEKIHKYSHFKPDKEDGFMRKVSEGQTVKVGCWIGETVKVRFK